MTAEALLELLRSTGLQVAYRAWKQPPALPYLVYLFTYDSDLVADDRNYQHIYNWQIELYSEEKDTVAEVQVEQVLEAAGIPYQKSETYLDTEDMTQVLYLIRTI